MKVWLHVAKPLRQSVNYSLTFLLTEIHERKYHLLDLTKKITFSAIIRSFWPFCFFPQENALEFQFYFNISVYKSQNFFFFSLKHHPSTGLQCFAHLWFWENWTQTFNVPIPIGSSKKQEISRKTSISDLLTMPKTLTVWITANCDKFLKRWE